MRKGALTASATGVAAVEPRGHRWSWLWGPAFVAAIAYVDPGNVAANLTAGARYGYLLVWVLVVANGMAVLVQYLSAKTGLVTGSSLPELLGSRLGRVPRILYWLQAELVAAATDLAEVLGGAIALQILFGVPLPLGGVIVGRAASDALEADADFMLRHGYTYSGHPAACAAALANIDIIEREGLRDSVTTMGAGLEAGLRSLEADGAFGHLRGEVAIFGAAMRPDQNAMAVRDRMLELGVVTRAIGTETVTFCPPFVTTDAQVDRIVDALATALR